MNGFGGIPVDENFQPIQKTRIPKNIKKSRFGGIPVDENFNIIYEDDYNPAYEDDYSPDEPGIVESTLIGAGKGLYNIGQGIGLIEQESEKEKEIYNKFQKEHPFTSMAGEIIGESAPFLLPGLGIPGAAEKLVPALSALGKTAPTVAKVIPTAALGASEAAISSAGREEKEIGKTAALGATLAGTIEALSGPAGRITGGVIRKITGKKLDDVIDETGNITKEVQEQLNKTPSEKINETEKLLRESEQKIENIATKIRNMARSGKVKDINNFMKELVKDNGINSQVLEDAEVLGLTQYLMPSFYSNNPAYKELEQGLASIIGSELGAKQKIKLEKIKQKGSQILEESGAQPMGDININIFDNMKQNIDDSLSQEKELYNTLKEMVPSQSKIDVTSYADQIIKDFEEVGDERILSPLEREALNIFTEKTSNGKYIPKSEGINFAGIDRFRKKIGESLGKNTNIFKDTEYFTKSKHYDNLTDLQGNIYDKFYPEGNEVWKEAKALTKNRKKIENNMINLYGKDLQSSISPKISRAIKVLQNGDIGPFNKIIKNIPTSEREEVILSGLNNFVEADHRKGFNFTKFANVMKGIENNKTIDNDFFKNINPSTKNKLKSLARISDSISNTLQDRVYTGRIVSLLDKFDDGSLFNKIKNVSNPMAIRAASNFIPGMNFIRNFTNVFPSEKSSKTLQEKVDKLLTSEVFEKSLLESIRNNSLDAGNKIIENSKDYKEWLKYIPKEQAQLIMKLGFMNWLVREDNEQRSN